MCDFTTCPNYLWSGLFPFGKSFCFSFFGLFGLLIDGEAMNGCHFSKGSALDKLVEVEGLVVDNVTTNIKVVIINNHVREC